MVVSCVPAKNSQIATLLGVNKNHLKPTMIHLAKICCLRQPGSFPQFLRVKTIEHGCNRPSTWICLRWLEKVKTYSPKGVVQWVIYHGRTFEKNHLEQTQVKKDLFFLLLKKLGTWGTCFFLLPDDFGFAESCECSLGGWNDWSELASFVLSRRYSEQAYVGTSVGTSTYPRHSYPLGSQTKSLNFE